jgi:hypothetical protein
MFAILGRVKPNTESIRGLNLAVVRHMTVQVTKLTLQPELILTGHDLLYQAWTERGLLYTYIVCIQSFRYIIQYVNKLDKSNAWGYKWDTLFLGDINTETGPRGWGSLNIQTIKHGQEFRGTQTRERLRWRGPESIENFRPDLSSEKLPTSTNHLKMATNRGRNM